jgi:hypothetical protein
MFDKILLLTRDGRLAYLGAPRKMVPHFEKVCNISCPSRANTSDFALDALSAEGENSVVTGEGFAKAFAHTDAYKKMLNYVTGNTQAGGVGGGRDGVGATGASRTASFDVEKDGARKSSEGSAMADSVNNNTNAGDILWEPADGSVIQRVQNSSTSSSTLAKPAPAPNFARKACMLFRRNFILEMRNKEIFAVQLAISIELGVLMGSVYWQVDVNKDPFSVLALCFMIVVLQSLGAITVIPSFIQQRQLFSHEVSCGLYDTAGFCLAAMLSDLVLQGLYAAAMSVPIFYMCGLGQDFGKFVAVNIVGRLAATTWAELVCVFFTDTAAANGAASGMMSFFVMFAGFVITYDNLPSYWQWANQASMLKYFYSPLVVSIAHESTTTLAGKVQIQALSELDLKETAWWHIWMLVGYLVLFRMVHAVSLSGLHTGRVDGRKRATLGGVSALTLVVVACWFAFVPDALKTEATDTSVMTANATAVSIDAPVAQVFGIMSNVSAAGEYDVYFATAHNVASPAYPADGGMTRRSWRLRNESGIFMDETPMEVAGSPELGGGGVRWAVLRHNINGFWRCPALGRMQFAVRYGLGEVDGGKTTRLQLSAEMLGASGVNTDDVEDVNQVMRQIQEIFNANAENLKAMAEAQRGGKAYERVHPYKVDGYLCE